MVCAPQLGCYEDIFPLDASIEGLFQTFAHFVFVAITVCAIDVSVSVLEGIRNGFLDFARSRLPSPFHKSVF